MHSYTVGVGNGGLMISVIQFGSMAPTKTPDAILQDRKNGGLAQSKTHLVPEKKITLGGAFGLDFETENETTHVKTRLLPNCSPS